MNHAAIVTAPIHDRFARTPVLAASPRRRLRGVGAVVAGLLATIASATAIDVVMHTTGVFPGWSAQMADSLYVLAAAYRLVCNAAGGYVAARIAPDRPVRHAWALAIVGTLLATVGFVVAVKLGPDFGPRWYPLLLVITAVPSTLAGAWLRARQLGVRAGG